MPSTISETLPSYDESLAQPILLDHTLSSQSDSSSISSTDAPPAFSLSPITLCLQPNSTIIIPLYHENVSARAVYELTSRLDGRHRDVYLAEVPVITKLNKYGHLPKIEKRHHLYKIFEAQEGAQRYTGIDGRKTRTIQGTILRRSTQGTAFVATNNDNIWGRRGQLIYCARMHGDVIEWMDTEGRVVAIDHLANERDRTETLQVLVPLDRKLLDMLVAVWIGRIHHARRNDLEDGRRPAEVSRPGRENKRRQSLLIGSRMFLKTLTA